jgi:hypothetical protein
MPSVRLCPGSQPGHSLLMLRLTFVAALLLAACTRSKAETAEGGALADRVEAALRRASPGVATQRLADSRIQLTAAGTVVAMSLDNLRAQCDSRPDTCNEAIERTARGALFAVSGDARKVTREQIRAAIKNDDWMGVLRAKLATAEAGADRQPITRPWVGGLTVIYVADFPDAVIPLRHGVQRELGIADAELDELAMRNLEAFLPQPKLSAVAGHDGLFAIYEGDDYCTSQLLFPQRFAALAEQLGGHLIVSPPVRNALLATGRQDPETLALMRETARETSQAQPHPLSTELFDWSATGFRVRPASEH